MARALSVAGLVAALASACTPRSAPTPLPYTAPATALPTVPSMGVLVETSQPTPETTALGVATGFPDPGAYMWALIAGGFDSPVDIQFAPDSSGRMFVVEQPGRIRIVSAGGGTPLTFMDITDRVNSQGNEQGLLGLAFDPRYSETGHFFVNYTDRHGHNVIARYRVTNDSNRADPSSEGILISVDDPFPNHNGGVVAFGPDGYLYAGLGDGGSGGDPLGSGQNTHSLLGKILRIDVEHGEPYAIPADNPFARQGGSPEVWAYGLRNPWRLSFDSQTGDLYVADVGQGTWEEVDFLAAGHAGGVNFGWNYREGAHAFAGVPPAGLNLVDPVAEYSHDQGGCSITGGYVYRGALADWRGVYLYGDFCSGKIWGLRYEQAAPTGAAAPGQARLMFETGANITTFGQDAQGEVYFADRGGPIYQLQPVP